jgi:hypothetical protein
LIKEKLVPFPGILPLTLLVTALSMFWMLRPPKLRVAIGGIGILVGMIWLIYHWEALGWGIWAIIKAHIVVIIIFAIACKLTGVHKLIPTIWGQAKKGLEAGSKNIPAEAMAWIMGVFGALILTGIICGSGWSNKDTYYAPAILSCLAGGFAIFWTFFRNKAKGIVGQVMKGYIPPVKDEAGKQVKVAQFVCPARLKTERKKTDGTPVMRTCGTKNPMDAKTGRFPTHCQGCGALLTGAPWQCACGQISAHTVLHCPIDGASPRKTKEEEKKEEKKEEKRAAEEDTCEFCGTINHKNSNHCEECGAQLKAADPPPKEDLPKPTHHTPSRWGKRNDL